MMGLDDVKTIMVARVSLMLTFLLLAVSLVSLLFQWYLVNGYSVEIFVFPLLFKYTPLGLVYLHSIIYFLNPVLKLQMDLLFLVPLAILVTGPITAFSYPIGKIVGCEKFGEAKNRLGTIINQGVKGSKRSFTQQH
jgi:hypothetical protein